MKRVTVPFFISHQGCPHACVFCDQRTISGSSGALPTATEILAKIHAWQGTAGNRPLEVAFFGGTFTALPATTQKRLLEPLQPLLASGAVKSVRISTRPDYIDEERVKWLSDQGVAIIELGVQSMDDQVLAMAGRGHDAASSAAAIRCIACHGISAVAQLMPGLPGDTPAKSVTSLHRVMAAGAGSVRIYPAVVLRGTGLAAMFEAGGYHPLSIDGGIKLCKILLHSAMKAGVDVIRIGLQADEGLNGDTVLAGCWHPALGQLVRSRLYADLLCQLAFSHRAEMPISIMCHPSRVSDVVGQGRINLKRLWSQEVAIKVKSNSSLQEEEVIINYIDQEIKGHIVTDLKYDIHEV